MKWDDLNQFLSIQESELVLLDENLVRMACSSPLYVRPHSKTVLNRAIKADTVFLSQQLIMDYSLLVGIDSTANELIVGIIGEFQVFRLLKFIPLISIYEMGKKLYFQMYLHYHREAMSR